MREVGTDWAVLNGPPKMMPSEPQGRKLITRYWGEMVVVTIALLLWLPRLSGPIDLRWDGGVYYLLGTSLAQGHGYRIASEPGSPAALQYPPLLPAVIAVYQSALGSSNPTVVGSYLRISYAALFVIYAVVVFALARKYLRPTWAMVATVLCLLHFQTIFLSDLLFAELPFAVLSVIFALVGSGVRSTRLSWQSVSFALAAAGFGLRTAGVALLAAWGLEPAFRRRWWSALLRSAIAILPIIAWQNYVMRVRASEDYAHAAYEYQRAPYQYYNVSYADNMRLLDPFRPELGRMTAGAFASRLTTNLPSVLASLGEGVSTKRMEWERILKLAQRRIVGESIISQNVALIPVCGFTVLVLAGLILLLQRRAWLMVLIIVGSIGLVWTTPWPAQFTRYMMPLGCFLSICAALALSRLSEIVRQHKNLWIARCGRIGVAAVLGLVFGGEVYTSLRLFYLRALPDGVVVSQSGGQRYRLFAHDRTWQAWEKATAWINANAPRDAIVATSAPHFLYLRTGLRAILPPMEADPLRARRLLEAVPVSYVIVDELDFLDISRRYGRPAVESDPTAWRVVQCFDRTRLYQRNAGVKE